MISDCFKQSPSMRIIYLEGKLRKCYWWEFRKKRKLREKLQELKNQYIAMMSITERIQLPTVDAKTWFCYPLIQHESIVVGINFTIYLN